MYTKEEEEEEGLAMCLKNVELYVQRIYSEETERRNLRKGPKGDREMLLWLFGPSSILLGGFPEEFEVRWE